MLCLGPGGWIHPHRAEAAVGKGIIDGRLGSHRQSAVIKEFSKSLGVRWVRVPVSWPTVEPSQGSYDRDALSRLDGLVAALHAAGVRVVLTPLYTPKWASDQSFWDDPPPGLPRGYQSYYPIDGAALDDLGDLGRMLARRYRGQVFGLECWNEPNLWGYIYPQRTAGDSHFGARTYLRMLKAFARGVRSSGTRVQVIAGATSPVGQNDKLRTSPQSFALFLKRNGAARWFDAYSHHPYTPGGTVQHAPDRPPNDLRTTVTLYNLSTLLRIFPRTPFYLTEYGYNTRESIEFAGFAVTEAQQASYLKKAYAMASRHRQVKALFWYLGQDVRRSGAEADGVYTGLRRVDGSKKPSWFAYRNVR